MHFMQSAILDKITPYLRRLPVSQCEVVYVLAETRKFLDRSGQEFGRLRFYCEWALHANMTRKTAREVLHEIDEAIAARDDGRIANGGFDALFTALFGLQEFRKRLHDFCERNNLPTVWTGTIDKWSKVVQHYGLIVQDCPVEIEEKQPTTRYIRKVVVSACRPDLGKMSHIAEPDEVVAFQVNWELRFLDETREEEVIFSFFSPESITICYWEPALDGEP